MAVASDDIKFMQEALTLARGRLGNVWPNPAVGCVLVKDGQIIGRGATAVGGRPHAEIVALESVGDDAFGATAYVTLEPCCHWGKTPPCVEALMEFGISRVVAALQDPDPRVNGMGLERLREASIKVDVGVCEKEAYEINQGFFHRVRTGKPLVTFIEKEKMHIGDLFYGGTLYDASISDLATWLKAHSHKTEGPLQIVIDDKSFAPARLAEKPKLSRESTWLVVTAGRLPGRTAMLENYVKRVVEVAPDADGRPDLNAILQELGRQGLTRLAVDTESSLAAQLRAIEKP